MNAKWVTPFAFSMSYVLYWSTVKAVDLRVPPEQETVGLDISQHNEFPELDSHRRFGAQTRGSQRR